MAKERSLLAEHVDAERAGEMFVEPDGAEADVPSTSEGTRANEHGERQITPKVR